MHAPDSYDMSIVFSTRQAELKCIIIAVYVSIDNQTNI